MQERGGGGGRKRPTRANGGDVFIGLDDISVSTDDVGVLRVGHQQQGFKVAQNFVGSPILGQLHYGPRKISVELLQLGFEAREKRKGVGGGSGETGENFVVIKTA